MIRTTHSFIALLAALVLTGICAGGESASKADGNESDPGDAKILIHKIIPSDCDRRIDTFTGAGEEHYSYFDPSAASKNVLIIFLPGTGGKGSASGRFDALAAHEGFHLVSIQYPDNISISHFQESDDPDAFAKARENVIFGAAPIGKLQVNAANCMENRIVTLLHYLADHFPDEHWNQYLGKKKKIDWEKVILAGSSQGGGHALYMATKHKVSRVIMFGSPKDFNMHFNKPAKWYSEPSATPTNRLFCFVHSEDEGHGCTYQQQLENYKALKLSPQYKVVDVDHSAPPYDHTHLFTSTGKVNNPHASVHQNASYRPVWKYLLEEPIE